MILPQADLVMRYADLPVGLIFVGKKSEYLSLRKIVDNLMKRKRTPRKRSIHRLFEHMSARLFGKPVPYLFGLDYEEVLARHKAGDPHLASRFLMAGMRLARGDDIPPEAHVLEWFFRVMESEWPRTRDAIEARDPEALARACAESHFARLSGVTFAARVFPRIRSAEDAHAVLVVLAISLAIAQVLIIDQFMRRAFASDSPFWHVGLEDMLPDPGGDAYAPIPLALAHLRQGGFFKTKIASVEAFMVEAGVYQEGSDSAREGGRILYEAKIPPWSAVDPSVLTEAGAWLLFQACVLRNLRRDQAVISRQWPNHLEPIPSDLPFQGLRAFRSELTKEWDRRALEVENPPVPKPQS